MLIEVTNKLDSDLIKQIRTLATEKDMSEQELITEYITKGIKQDTPKARIITTKEELEEVLEYDNPDGDDILERLCGIASADE